MITILRWIWNYKELIFLQNPILPSICFWNTLSVSWEKSRTSHSSRIKDLDLDFICHNDVCFHHMSTQQLTPASPPNNSKHGLEKIQISCPQSNQMYKTRTVQHPCMERVGAGKAQLESMDWISTANHKVNCVINQQLMLLLSAVSTWTTPSMYFHSVSNDGKNGLLVKTGDHGSCNHNKLVRNKY